MKQALFLMLISTFMFSAKHAQANKLNLQPLDSVVVDCDGLVIEIDDGHLPIDPDYQGKLLRSNPKAGVYIIQFTEIKTGKKYAPQTCVQIVAN